jgi:hypothetical protein
LWKHCFKIFFWQLSDAFTSTLKVCSVRDFVPRFFIHHYYLCQQATNVKIALKPALRVLGAMRSYFFKPQQSLPLDDGYTFKLGAYSRDEVHSGATANAM